MAQRVCVVLSAAEREQLAAIAADRNRSRKHIERSQIILASADRHPVRQVAQRIGISRPTVWRWQQRFAESGVDGLLRDKTRKPGKPPIAAEIAAQVVALTCTEPPHEATHWTGRAMAKTIGISLGSVQGEMLVRGVSIDEIARRLRRDKVEVRDKVAEVGRACR